MSWQDMFYVKQNEFGEWGIFYIGTNRCLVTSPSFDEKRAKEVAAKLFDLENDQIDEILLS